MTYVGERERADSRALDQLEAILRVVTEEVAGWRARALKAESDLKEARPRGGATSRADADVRNRGAGGDMESENKTLRLRVDAARARVGELLQRLTFLEEQANAAAGGNGGRRAEAK
ncbi:MAG TPA: hypothetical protein VEO73_05025 [Gemmatimonadales bacterium]|nr:hypothetical protein [Gemmatimonadales bacterium]